MPDVMRAMVLERQGEPLRLARLPVPVPGPGQLLLRVHACGVCRTDLHIVDGDLREPKLPLVPGHQIVASVAAVGRAVAGYTVGDRVGAPWLGGSCGGCVYCVAGQENLCDAARYTGYQLDGGFAEYCLADPQFCFPIPAGYPDLQAAPLLCAGLIGYRALRMAGDARRLGFYGFGAAAHILVQVARFQRREVYALTSPGDNAAQEFALSLGAVWAGGSDESPPAQLDAAIIFAPVGELVPAALGAVRKGGVVVCAGIHMSDIPAFPYSLLWGERVLRSVANLTRADGEEFLALAPRVPVRTVAHAYPLEAGQCGAGRFAPRALHRRGGDRALDPHRPRRCGRFWRALPVLQSPAVPADVVPDPLPLVEPAPDGALPGAPVAQSSGVALERQSKLDLSQGGILGHVIRLALPSALANLFNFSYNFVNMIWLSRLGPSAIAVTATYQYFFMVFVIFNQIVGLGSFALIARTYGAKEYTDCRRLIGQTFSFKLVIAIAVMALGLIFQRWAWVAFGSAPEVVEQGVAYSTIMFAVIPIYFSTFTLNTSLRGIGDMKHLLLISSVSTVLHLVIDPFLIFSTVSIGPFPTLGILKPLMLLPGMGLGVAGAAWASFGCDLRHVRHGPVLLHHRAHVCAGELAAVLQLGLDYDLAHPAHRHAAGFRREHDQHCPIGYRQGDEHLRHGGLRRQRH